MKAKFQPKQIFCPKCEKPLWDDGKVYFCLITTCENYKKAYEFPTVEMKEAK